MPTPFPIPPGARLVHIGPYKTGTTALQSVLHRGREQMLEQGVQNVSHKQHDRRAGQWIVQRIAANTDPADGEREWQAVVGRLTAATTDRRVFSTEYLSDASDQQVEQILDQIGRDDLWIAVTLRPLAKILPSQYQQGLQARGVREYDDWLHSVLDENPATPPPSKFWVRHRHDELVRRWADRLGTERVVVVVLDGSDRQFLPHAFEDLLGLRRDTLASQKATENRSLTAPEAELLRSFNRRYRELGLKPDYYARLFSHQKFQMKLRQPAPDEPRLVTPDWAITRANEVAGEMADNIRALGVPVFGDLGSLSTAPIAGVDAIPAPPETVDIELAAWFAGGLALSARRVQATAVAAARPAPGRAAPTAPRARSLLRRVRDRLRR